jgi:hypothetical protein
MAAKSHVQGPAEGAGKKVDCVAVTRGADTVYRQVVVVAESDDDDLILRHVAAGTLQAVPTGATDLVGATCKLARLHFSNPTAGLVAVTVWDKSGTPLVLLPGYEIPPGAWVTLELGRVVMTGGIRWQAGGAGLNGYAEAYTA